MRFITETGTEYEIQGEQVRRVGGDPMRRDGEWLRLLENPAVVVGKPVTLVLEPLGEGNLTLRTTTPVTVIR